MYDLLGFRTDHFKDCNLRTLKHLRGIDTVMPILYACRKKGCKLCYGVVRTYSVSDFFLAIFAAIAECIQVSSIYWIYRDKEYSVD